jgi:Protein of unknown function (DUF3168)
MYPPIYETCAADTTVQGLLLDSSGRLRLYPFGEAPQNDPAPYAVWQIVYGIPANSLSCRPDVDMFGVQVDVYAADADPARAVASAIRTAVELLAPVQAFNGEFRDAPTRRYRVSFTVEWWMQRS